MTRRMTGWIGAAALAAIVALGLVWALYQPDAETDVYADELDRQNRTGEGSNVDGIADVKDDNIRMPEEPGALIDGSTDANDLTTIADPDNEVEGWTNEGSRRMDPDEVVSPETGTVDNETGLIMTDEPAADADEASDDTDAAMSETDEPAETEDD